jgi:hypothetical protein
MGVSYVSTMALNGAALSGVTKPDPRFMRGYIIVLDMIKGLLHCCVSMMIFYEAFHFNFFHSMIMDQMYLLG